MIFWKPLGNSLRSLTTFFVAGAGVSQLDSGSLLAMLEPECYTEEDRVTYQHLRTYISALDLEFLKIYCSHALEASGLMLEGETVTW